MSLTSTKVYGFQKVSVVGPIKWLVACNLFLKKSLLGLLLLKIITKLLK